MPFSSNFHVRAFLVDCPRRATCRIIDAHAAHKGVYGNGGNLQSMMAELEQSPEERRRKREAELAAFSESQRTTIAPIFDTFGS